MGTVTHYYPKTSIAEIEVHASDLVESQPCLITGVTTGVMRVVAEDIHVDGKPATYAKQGDMLTIKVPDRVRANDKFYKLVSSK